MICTFQLPLLACTLLRRQPLTFSTFLLSHKMLLERDCVSGHPHKNTSAGPSWSHFLTLLCGSHIWKLDFPLTPVFPCPVISIFSCFFPLPLLSHSVPSPLFSQLPIILSDTGIFSYTQHSLSLKLLFECLSLQHLHHQLTTVTFSSVLFMNPSEHTLDICLPFKPAILFLKYNCFSSPRQLWRLIFYC